MEQHKISLNIHAYTIYYDRQFADEFGKLYFASEYYTGDALLEDVVKEVCLHWDSIIEYAYTVIQDRLESQIESDLNTAISKNSEVAILLKALRSCNNKHTME